MTRDPYHALYERGIAVGEPGIVDETMNFRFRDETFSFPSMVVYPFVEDTGYGFYTVPVEKLRQLRREAAH